MYFFNYYTLGFLLIPGILLGLYAEIKVQSTYNKYKQAASASNRPAHEIAKMFLDCAGLQNIKIIPIRGHLTDYYDPKKKIIALSESVYNSTSIAAIGVACHEVGHAIQYKNNYLPIKIRNFLIPICNIGNRFLWVVFMLAIFFYYFSFSAILIDIGILIFAITTLLNLVTLPVEYNASNRAVQLLNTSGTLSQEECYGVKKVLNSAALTYVAGFIMSLLSLIRLILIFKDRE